MPGRLHLTMPHTGWEKDVDGWFPGYRNMDAAAATTMLELLNTPGGGKRVKYVYVTHRARDGAPFFDAYKNAVTFPLYNASLNQDR